jgi:hypothetical protein
MILMEEFFRQMWEMLIGRVHGPFAFRLILQPLTAAFFACRAGLRDARAGRPAFGWAIIANPAVRREFMREARQELTRMFVFAVVIDLVYEVIVFHRIYPGQSFLVAAFLAVLPYALLRGPVNRMICAWRRSRGSAAAIRTVVTHLPR